MAKARLEARIRYEENYCGRGEYYVFETKYTNESDWGLDTAFKLRESETGECELLHYTALTKIREYQMLGIPFRFE